MYPRNFEKSVVKAYLISEMQLRGKCQKVICDDYFTVHCMWVIKSTAFCQRL
jgi:hypothetical protein